MCDEPTGNLDTRTSKDVIQLFRDLNRESGITVILVTHDPAVAHVARRIVVLRDGLIVEDTTDYQRAMDALHAASELDDVAPEMIPDPGPPRPKTM
jgi:putative ABC transport system ATP-binding protein